MRLTIDFDADALYLRLNDAAITDSEEVAPGVVLDYDAENKVVGVEMLHVSKRVDRADLQRVLPEWLPLAGYSAAVREERELYGPQPL